MFPPYGGLGLFLNTPLGLARYGTLSLTDSSPAQSFIEPMTLAEIKSFLKIPARSPVDDEEDATLNGFLSAAREQAEILQNRDLVVKQWDMVHDYWPAYAIEMRSPLVSVDLVKYRDSNGNYFPLVEGTDYIVDAAKKPGSILPPYNQTWPAYTPWPTSSLLIRFSSGMNVENPFWSGPGARIKIGMKLLISAWYNNRIPFETGRAVALEYPYSVTSCLGYGALERAL